MSITCPSRIVRVTVHGRGALVTRRMSVPAELPDGDVALLAEGVTVLAEGGSVRAALHGASPARTVVAVRTALAIPPGNAPLGDSAERLRSLTARIERLEIEHRSFTMLRARCVALPLRPLIGSTTVAARTEDALATAVMLSGLSADLDGRLGALEASLRTLQRERDAAVLEDLQARTADRVGEGHPTRTVTVHLAGDGPVEAMEITYVVPAARWWPVYTLRITDGTRKARWWIEALVAQRTGEDWTGVGLALSTADLAFDARLPELSSLRLGRAQPVVHKGYRAPPPGLDGMFSGYDRAFGPGTVTLQTAMPSPSFDGALARDAREEAALEEEAPTGEYFGLPGSMGGGGVPMPQAAPAAPMGALRRARSAATLVGSTVQASAAPRAKGFAAEPPPAEDDGAIEPADAWLDFDALTLSPAGVPHRGRLARREDPVGASARQVATGTIEALTPPGGAMDPVVSRGMFDHRYDADGMADVPSDGQTHRVTVGTAETVPTVRWRTVPGESPEVYREVEFRNPFDAPLLSGPVDVYLDGALLAVATVDRIDRGGTLYVGMGVEERIRVARNVRTAEEPAGLLGGSTAVVHTVGIELTSSLGASALVEVIDRLPVSDEKGVEVTEVWARPAPEAYTQADRGAVVRGGMLWRQVVAAGARVSLEYQYRITLPSKSEIVGGNRRG